MKKKILCMMLTACTMMTSLVACQSSTNEATTTETQAETQSETQTERETKKSENREIYNSDITYETLVKYPEQNINSTVKFSGKVVEIVDPIEEGFSCVWMAVDNNYKNLLIVAYKDNLLDKELLVGDKITIYGGYGGEWTCTSNKGNSIGLPLVLTFIIDLENN